MEQGMEQGIEQGMAKGMAKGRKEEKMDMARKLKSMGILSVGQIAEATGLSVEEIEKLGV